MFPLYYILYVLSLFLQPQKFVHFFTIHVFNPVNLLVFLSLTFLCIHGNNDVCVYYILHIFQVVFRCELCNYFSFSQQNASL